MAQRTHCSPRKANAEKTSFCESKKSGVGISQTTRLIWRDVSESSLVCFVEKWLPCFQGDIWLHLPASWTRPFKAKYSLSKGCRLEQVRAIALCRLGTGNSYRTTGITFGQGKSTVIKICEDFMETIRHKDDFIRFPDDPLDVALTMRRVESIAGFPNVVGAIDCSHITIKAPQVNHEDYFNRKQNYSSNLQGLVSATRKFIDVSTGWPGSIHDARVLRLSTLYQRAENNLILTEPVKRIKVTIDLQRSKFANFFLCSSYS